MSARARFLLVRMSGIVFGVPVVFVILTFGLDAIFIRRDPADDLVRMRPVIAAIVVVLCTWQGWLERRRPGEAAQGDDRALGRDDEYGR